MSPVTTITAKRQIDTLPHDAEVEIVGEYLTCLMASEGWRTSYSINRNCQLRLSDGLVLVTIDDELRYAPAESTRKGSEPPERHHKIRLPARVEVVTDTYDDSQHRMLRARSTTVVPAE